MTARRRVAFAALLALAPLGCRDRSEPARPTIVFAAASLTAPFLSIAAEFERRHPGPTIDLHFAGTPQLVLQLREGAPADVFAAADDANMQRVVDAGLVVAPPRTFARNHLMIVTAPGDPNAIRGLSDLARDELRVVLCGPDVPAGRYARQALAKAGVAVRSLSDEPSVNAVVSKVRLGEVDAGVVYATDAANAGDAVTAVPIATEHDVEVSYPIAVLSRGSERTSGESFVRFVMSPDGQRILRSFGFTAP